MPPTDTHSCSSASTFSSTHATWNPPIAGSALSYEAPFGTIISQSGDAADDNPFRFSTKYHEATDVGTSGDTPRLIYYGYRFYDPEFGRWVSRDPIGEDPGANLLLFCLNAPVSHSDSFGLTSAAGSSGRARCKRAVVEFKAEYESRLNTLLVDKKCPMPRLDIRCEPRGTGGCKKRPGAPRAPYGRYHRSYGGQPYISICYVSASTRVGMKGTMTHEVQHALQHCNMDRPAGKKGCKKTLFDELEARFCQHVYPKTQPAPWWTIWSDTKTWGQLEEGAWASSKCVCDRAEGGMSKGAALRYLKSIRPEMVTSSCWQEHLP